MHNRYSWGRGYKRPTSSNITSVCFHTPGVTSSITIVYFRRIQIKPLYVHTPGVTANIT